ncbi:MAG: DUF971 domain-containing protein [Acidobacteriota bacterium]|nr:DUF971 domain-containing protein [Acidobacteriota bacterium]MDH3785539.1 DUF971 domain-containing protein [Acidobacteriota bacterium]
MKPTRITPFPNGEIGIVWDDDHETYLSNHRLRCACPCAVCVDEMSGRKILDDSRVAADIAAMAIHAVGQYGIGIRWSDGHDTGIYTYRTLREMCECEACRGEGG